MRFVNSRLKPVSASLFFFAFLGLNPSPVRAATFEITGFFEADKASTFYSSATIIISTPSAQAVSLWVSTSAVTPHLYVSTNGLIGIGTANPAARLDISGAVRLGAAGGNNLLNTGAAAGAATGPLYWGDKALSQAITVKGIGGTPVTVLNVSTIEFNQATGLEVSDIGGNTARVQIGSHWKELTIDGLGVGMIPYGQETLNFVKGTNINITADPGASTKTLTVALTADIAVSTLTVSSITTTGAGVMFSTNVFLSSGAVVRGLIAPIYDDEAVNKAYVDAATLDRCALGVGTVADIMVGASCDINCDNMAELGTLATQTLDVSTDEVKTGVYAATWLSVVDADLTAGNIISTATIFGKVGTFTAGATATSNDILSGKTAGVNGSMVTGTMPTQTLSAANDTVSAGYYNVTTLSAVDADLAAGNIAVSTVIFGKTGTYTSDANATAGAILASSTAYVNGVKLTGTIQTRALDPASETVQAGYYSATTLSAVDADLAVGNIKSGVTIFGKAGTLTSGALPDSGQSTSYTATFGEDHDYAPAGTQLSYTDNTDGTITDNRTGLMWIKSADNTTRTWEQAISTCEARTYATYSDWRLPNVRELMSIVNYQNQSPAISTAYFTNTASDYYWTSTTYVLTTTYAWGVYFDFGSVVSGNKAVTNYVRCVRGGP